MAELERMRMEADEDDQLVGPQLPDQYRAGGGGSNYGGALRPGEGERWVQGFRPWEQGKCIRLYM